MAEQTLEEALATWDREAVRAKIETQEQQREDVLTRFPRAEWPTMPLERFALGTDASDQSFAYAMEWGARELGSISGGSSKKFLVFKRRDSGEWYFDKQFDTVEDAWTAVRAAFVQAMDLAEAGDFDAIGQLTAIYGAPALTTKIVFTYVPDSVIPINSHAHLLHFWALLGGQGKVPKGVPGARRLLELVRQRSEFTDWAPAEIMYFLYDWSDPTASARIVKIAPGRDAFLWDDCLANGYIRVGWDEVGDLRDFGDKEEFRERFGAEFLDRYYKGSEAKTSEKANEVWALTELEPGDLILANKGTSRILGVGTVREPGYERRSDLTEYAQTVRVEWDTSQAREIAPIRRWAFKTIAPVSRAEYQRIQAGTADTGVSTVPSAAVADPIFGELDEALTRKGQAILYGPPGTGKTYNARRFSVWWLARRAGVQGADRLLVDHDAFLERERGFSTAQAAGRVWWVVANPQRWTWDVLFDEGQVDYDYGRVKSNYALLEPGDLVVGYQARPDKRIVAVARVREGLHDVEGAPQFTIEPVARVSNGPTLEELKQTPELSGSQPLRNNNQGMLFALTADEAQFLLSWLAERDPSLPYLLTDDAESVGQLTRATFHPSYTYEDFVEGYKPVSTGTGQLDLRLQDGLFKRICRAALADPDRPYLVLVDEINRGNIPKIFGELITLLERDKRDLSVVLPQSREAFNIPPNVHLLGTMNTADRSIRLLDAALRRRFAFIELMPDTSVLEGGRVGGLDLAQFLAELNRRIARIEGREKQVGHSFFLDGDQPISDVDEFASRFRHEVLPLLQEYAYEDYRELASYLGPGFIDAEEQRLVSERIEDPESLIAGLIEEFQPAASAMDDSD